VRWGGGARAGERAGGWAGVVPCGAALELWFPSLPFSILQYWPQHTNLLFRAPTHRCRLALFLSNGDQVVDFSCGENYFVPYLKKRCLRCGQGQARSRV
jgi:hypothetical protein